MVNGDRRYLTIRCRTIRCRNRVLDLHLTISNDIVSSKIYDKRDDFDFEIVNFPF